jgi:spore maturation protein CgeB
LRLYDAWSKIVSQVRQELSSADVAVVGSYFPDGIVGIDEVLDSRVPVKAFYDIDTPITISRLREHGETEYLKSGQIAGFHVYFSFTGGPILREIEQRFEVPFATELYCSFDPAAYRRFKVNKRFACDLSYMGTYAADRQAKVQEFLIQPAEKSKDRSFIVAGPQYPKSIVWPENVRRIVHLNPRWHARFYSSSRLTLNVTRREMVRAGFSPSVRLFEAAACGAAIVSDNWPGLDTFFIPGKEILLPVDAKDVVRYLALSDDALRSIGSAAQERVLLEHTSDVRAQQFEKAVVASKSRQLPLASVMVN